MKPWLSLYTGRDMAGARVGTLPELFSLALERDPGAPAIRYFDGSLSYAELDEKSSAFAAALQDAGFEAGQRLALLMQNMPHFIIAKLGAWKAGGIVVPISPLSRATELGKVLPDCEPTVVVAETALLPYLQQAIDKIDSYAPLVLCCAATELQSRNDARVLPPEAPAPEVQSFLALLDAFAGQSPSDGGSLAPDDLAYIVYTSGTTGVPKGAMISHSNVCWNAEAMTHWYHLEPGTSVLALAPLFHVTGLVGASALSWALGGPVILNYRFHPEVMLDTLLEHRPGFTVGAITAFIAMMNTPGAGPDHYRSFKVIVSGGAPIPPSVVEAFHEHSGHYVHNGYGLTESAAGVIAVPMDQAAPVDPDSGSLAIGVPKYQVGLRVLTDDGVETSPGEYGEIVLTGHSIVSGYWNRPEATAESMCEDGFRTGDVGFVDEKGWVYLVDRKKDMINASGFKVWPREVEDVLYAHPAVREAAVIGEPDEYRGETVVAVVSLRPGAECEPDELRTFCRERLAAYKVPREVRIMDDLPKTPTGKILRRALRASATA